MLRMVSIAFIEVCEGRKLGGDVKVMVIKTSRGGA